MNVVLHAQHVPYFTLRTPCILASSLFPKGWRCTMNLAWRGRGGFAGKGYIKRGLEKSNKTSGRSEVAGDVALLSKLGLGLGLFCRKVRSRFLVEAGIMMNFLPRESGAVLKQLGLSPTSQGTAERLDSEIWILRYVVLTIWRQSNSRQFLPAQPIRPTYSTFLHSPTK